MSSLARCLEHTLLQEIICKNREAGKRRKVSGQDSFTLHVAQLDHFFHNPASPTLSFSVLEKATPKCRLNCQIESLCEQRCDPLTSDVCALDEAACLEIDFFEEKMRMAVKHC